ncbi:hypothetical protein DVS77_33415 [Mycolicibacterium moriokaense]|nr:hypothetical protein DVS77_33415 [Mycolicibacterium moriokaense]
MIAMADTEALLAQIAGLQRQVADLQQQVVALTSVEPNNAEDRFGVSLNMTYCAPVTGYLSVSPTDGRTGRLRLLVGYHDPPDELVATANSGGDRGYLGAVIREGEYFVLDAGGKNPAFRCVFTPFF